MYQEPSIVTGLCVHALLTNATVLTSISRASTTDSSADIVSRCQTHHQAVRALELTPKPAHKAVALVPFPHPRTTSPAVAAPVQRVAREAETTLLCTFNTATWLRGRVISLALKARKRRGKRNTELDPRRIMTLRHESQGPRRFWESGWKSELFSERTGTVFLMSHSLVSEVRALELS